MPQLGLTKVGQAVVETKFNRRSRLYGRWPADWPRISELDFSERVLLRAVRRLSVINTETSLVVPDLERLREETLGSVGHGLGVTLGPQVGSSAATELEMILRSFCCMGFRPFQIHRICELPLSTDERLLLSFVAGCQAKDSDHVWNVLSWLLPLAGAKIITAYGYALAKKFHEGGLVLPQRLEIGGCIGYSEMMPCRNEFAYTPH